MASTSESTQSKPCNYAELETRLADEYGFDQDEINDIVTALRLLYMKYIDGKYGVPKEALSTYDDELQVLVDLGMIADDYNYRFLGETSTVASIIVDRFVHRRELELESLRFDFSPTSIAFFLRFGFDSITKGHLTTRTNIIEDQDWITDPHVIDQYYAFRLQLLNKEFAVHNEWQESVFNYQKRSPILVVPYEFNVQYSVFDSQIRTKLPEMECYRVVEAIINDSGNKKSRRELLQPLTVAEICCADKEGILETEINKLHQRGLTTEYSPEGTPTEVIAPEEFRELVKSRVKANMQSEKTS